MNRRLNAALTYVARGWAVLPIRAGGKEPLVPRGFKVATTDAGKVRDWFHQWPDMNIAVQPGASGLIVADIDSPSAEAAAIGLGLYREPSLSVATGRRHYPADHLKHFARSSHLYFRPRSVPCPVTKRTVQGIEFIGRAGYVLVPPSTHAPTGTPYEFECEAEPLVLPLEAWEALTAPPIGRPDTRRSPRDRRNEARALGYLRRLAPSRADDYNSWLQVGMALHEATGGSQTGLAAWREWSRQSHKFDHSKDDCAEKWISFGKYGGTPLTIASLVDWARADSLDRYTRRAADLESRVVA